MAPFVASLWKAAARLPLQRQVGRIIAAGLPTIVPFDYRGAAVVDLPGKRKNEVKNDFPVNQIKAICTEISLWDLRKSDCLSKKNLYFMLLNLEG